MSSNKNDWLDAAVADYVTAHAAAPDGLMRDLVAETAQVMGDRSRMQIATDQGALMSLLVRLIGARSAVEVGTFTGMSALCIARALPADGRLICCDVSEEYTAIGKRYWERAGVADRIDLRIGPALDTLRAMPLDTEIDLAFIDADKANYAAYYEELLLRLRHSGLILIDNTLWSGRVLAPASADDDADTAALRRLNDVIAADDRVESYLLPISDGLTMVRKR
jgi:caffeoyl-CoA O-methyltransferase